MNYTWLTLWAETSMTITVRTQRTKSWKTFFILSNLERCQEVLIEWKNGDKSFWRWQRECKLQMNERKKKTSFIQSSSSPRERRRRRKLRLWWDVNHSHLLVVGVIFIKMWSGCLDCLSRTLFSSYSIMFFLKIKRYAPRTQTAKIAVFKPLFILPHDNYSFTEGAILLLRLHGQEGNCDVFSPTTTTTLSELVEWHWR